MTVAASSILNRARAQLIDQGTNGAPQRWADTELLNFLSDGQRTLVAALPRAASKLSVISLVAGTRQAIPADGHCFLTAYRNMAADGVTPGASCALIARSVLDTQYPTWHTATATSAVVVFTYDLSDQTAFYVYPPSTGTTKLEINYAFMPPDLSTTSSALTVKDIYQTCLLDYVMYRAHQKDSDYAGGQTVAAAYLQSFMTFLGAANGDPQTGQTMHGQT